MLADKPKIRRQVHKHYWHQRVVTRNKKMLTQALRSLGQAAMGPSQLAPAQSVPITPPPR